MHNSESRSALGAPGTGTEIDPEHLGVLVAATRASTVGARRHAGVVEPFVAVVIPAHNEQEHIEACLRSVRTQSRPVDLVIVVADNCTDATVPEAVAAGATVVATVGNCDRKAGALNFVLNRILTHLDADDAVLLMDADTELDDNFVAVAARHLWAEKGDGEAPVGGVGGIFVGSRHLTDPEGRWSLVRHLQHNEYVRYARHVGRRRGRALVLTGTGTLFRVGALRDVAGARQVGELPDEAGSRSVYDTASLTEDNELTLSLKRLGYRTLSPRKCLVYTAMMPTVPRLFEQRRRWQRGALENLGSHGVVRPTAPYLARQVGTYLGVLFLPLYVMTLTTTLVRYGSVDWFHPLWVTVAVTYLVEQAWSVRRGGWRSVGLSLAVLPELWHTILLNWVYAMSLLGVLTGSGEQWGRGVDERAANHLADQGGRIRRHGHGVPTQSDLSGAHDHRQWWRLALVPVVVMLAAGLIIVLPLVALSAAWSAIAVFVLAGFGLTIVRLIPLPTA
jgi:cellulose synthase/poly-beta-1,6-N-acetylglucosamine synthase-like glycosyltransferase